MQASKLAVSATQRTKELTLAVNEKVNLKKIVITVVYFKMLCVILLMLSVSL